MARWTAAFVLAALLSVTPAPSAANAEEAQRPWRFDGVDRVVAVGDVHGASAELIRLLQSLGVVSDTLQWCGGGTHLVMLGDLVDRGPDGRGVLDLVMRLQGEAAAAGGQVHVVLGNHEVMNLVGDLRYVSGEGFAAFAGEEDEAGRERAFERFMKAGRHKKSEREAAQQDFDRLYPPGFFARQHAFSSHGVYGRWLLDQQILVVVDGVAYLHGGLAPCLAELAPEGINTVAMGELERIVEARDQLMEAGVLEPETPYAEVHEIARRYVHRWRSTKLPRVQANLGSARVLRELPRALAVRGDGPLWYRGSSLNPAAEEEPLAASMLERLGASTAVVGHTPSHTGRIAVRLDGRVVMADTGMLASHYKGRASAVLDQGGVLLAYYPGEGASPLPGAAPTAAEAAASASAAAEWLLAAAPVLRVEEVGSGSTQPLRVTLADGDRQIRAIFKSVDGVARDRVHVGELDSYRNEIAAYRVDRILGLGLVPVTVSRRLDGRPGSLQLWVEDAISEASRVDEDLQPPDGEAFARQRGWVEIFDVLINNPHRNSTNLLVTTHDWKLHLIDHAAAFAPAAARPAELEGVTLRLDLDVVNRLRTLTAEELQRELGDLLDEDQLAALLARRDLILAPWRAPDEESPLADPVVAGGAVEDDSSF